MENKGVDFELQDKKSSVGDSSSTNSSFLSRPESGVDVLLPTIILEEDHDNIEGKNSIKNNETTEDNNKNDDELNMVVNNNCSNNFNIDNSDPREEQQFDITITSFLLPSTPTPSPNTSPDLEQIIVPATPPRNDAVQSFRRKRRRLRACVLIQLFVDLISVVIPFVPSIVEPHTFYHTPLILSPLVAQIYLHKPSKRLFVLSLICYIVSATYCVCLCVYGLVLLGLGIGFSGGALFGVIPFIASALVILAIDGVGSILICSIRLHCISSSEEDIADEKNIVKSNKKKFICYRARPLEDILLSKIDQKSPVKVSKILDKMEKKAKKKEAPIIVDSCVAEPVSAFDVSQAVPSPNTDQLRELEALMSAAAKASTQAFLNASSIDNSSGLTSNTSSKSLGPLGPGSMMLIRHKMEAEARKHQPLRKGVLCDESASESVEEYEFQSSHEGQRKEEESSEHFANVVKTPMQPKIECDAL